MSREILRIGENVVKLILNFGTKKKLCLEKARENYHYMEKMTAIRKR